VRLAFVSPLPPAPTGIADYSADVLALLAGGHALDVFHGQEAIDRSRLPVDCGVFHARDLLARHAETPYDLVVHQLGNNTAHLFQYDLLARVPGLLVLHDLVLFHSRASAFLDAGPVRAWRAAPDSAEARAAARPVLDAWLEELEYSYPGRGRRLYEAHLGSAGTLLPYAYPLFRLPVEASCAVVVHNEFMARAVRAEVPLAEVAVVPQPVERLDVAPQAVSALRARLGFGPGDVVVGVFGLLTPEKRVDTVAHAMAQAVRQNPALQLLLVGPVPPRAGLESRLDGAGLNGRWRIAGRVPLDQLSAHIEAADVVVHLRYPSGRETSAALLRVLAQGRAAIVSDLEHQSELPDGAVRRISLVDEHDQLLAALLGLAGDPAARSRLGRAAAEHVRVAHAPDRVRQAWERALARSFPDPPVRDWPAHWPRPARRQRES